MLQHSCGCTQCEQASRALRAQATSHTDGYSRQPYMCSLFDCSSRNSLTNTLPARVGCNCNCTSRCGHQDSGGVTQFTA